MTNNTSRFGESKGVAKYAIIVRLLSVVIHLARAEIMSHL